jgi:pyocin large subunit-like protein
MSKVKIVLLVVLLILAFIGAKYLYDQMMTLQEEPVAAEPAEMPASDPQGAEVPPPEEEPEEEIAWDYSTFPEDYAFRSKKLLNEHFEKHGKEMGFESAEAYAESANLVIHHPDVLHKIEKDDGDTCFYLEDTNEFVVLSTDGYIRTYFWPDSGKKYYDKQ